MERITELALKIMFWLTVICLLICMTGCAHERIVVVPQTQERIVNIHDTVFHKDSTVEKSSTVIQKADSALLAQYGIRMGKMEEAWLVLQQQSKENKSSKEKTIVKDSIIRDSIPVPYPKVECKEKELSSWQKAEMELGDAFLTVLAMLLIYLAWHYYKKKK